MAYSEQTLMKMVSEDDWSRFTLGDFRNAVETGIIATLQGGIAQNMESVDYWLRECADKVEYLAYIVGQVTFSPFSEPDGTVRQCVDGWCNRLLDSNSKHNMFVGYLRTFFYKYLSQVEIPLLRAIVQQNPSLSLRQAAEYYVTQLLYKPVIEANPGAFLTFEHFRDIPDSRKAALRKHAANIEEALRRDDGRSLYKEIFYMMTFYAGTSYRRVHAAVCALLGNIDMAAFREAFYSQLDSIIEAEGALELGKITFR